MIKLIKLLGIIERCNVQFRTKKFKDLEINGCHNPYFFVLNKKEGLTQDELAKDLHLNKSNVTRAIQSLNEKGYVNVKTDENDKRVNRVYLSSLGKEKFPVIKNIILENKKRLLDGFNDEEIYELERLLNKLVINAERMCEDENI